jgi:TatD DNase family protein
MWADSHCHIDYDGVGPSAIDDARQAGVTRIVTIGTDATASAAAVATAREHDGVWATVGLHPHQASEGLDGVAALLDPPDPVVVGVGECGLDFYYEHSPRAAQREVFAAQIRLAASLDLTLVVHTRDAWDETFDILSTEGVPPRWILHCFSGGVTEAKRGLDLGAYLSFSGIVTFKKADDVREAAATCPLDRLLVETDSPYLAPVPNRGQANRPGWVPIVGAAVAQLRGVDVAAIERATWDNTARVFRLADAPVA